MAIGKKIGSVIGIIIIIVIAGLLLSSQDLQKSTQTSENNQVDRTFTQEELPQKLDEKKIPTQPHEIELSKLKSGLGTNDIEKAYYDNAEKLLTEYFLEYKGQDKSGDTITNMFLTKGALLNSFDCDSDKLDSRIKIIEWDDEKINLQFNSDDFNCKQSGYLYFNYFPKSDRLEADEGQDGYGQANTLLGYLNIDP